MPNNVDCPIDDLPMLASESMETKTELARRAPYTAALAGLTASQKVASRSH